MDGQYLVKSSVKAPILSVSKPTPTLQPADTTIRTAELTKGMQPPMTTRETAPSITLGTM